MPGKYLGRTDYRHGEPERCAVLVVNLGTPAAPDTAAVRRYLAQFLRDPRVIEVSRAIWLPLLYGVILPFRSRRSAHAYRSVWSAAGSPLRVGSEALAQQLGAALHDAGIGAQVRLAMRYGEPSIPAVLRALQREGLRRVLVLPLYPQYSATTTASVIDAVTDELRTWRWQPELRTITDYHREAGWLDAMAASIRDHWQHEARGEHLLFSFHGIPQRYFAAGDPYFCQCQFSAREIAARLQLDATQWSVSFQSRVGREEWLRPYTDDTVRSLAARGVRRLDVVCPGFSIDCLETLEEIAILNAGFFRAAGGERLAYVPALNDSPAHVGALRALLQRQGSGWPEFAGTGAPGQELERAARELRQREAFTDA